MGNAKQHHSSLAWHHDTYWPDVWLSLNSGLKYIEGHDMLREEQSRCSQYVER